MQETRVLETQPFSAFYLMLNNPEFVQMSMARHTEFNLNNIIDAQIKSFLEMELEILAGGTRQVYAAIKQVVVLCSQFPFKCSTVQVRAIRTGKPESCHF